MSVNNSDFIYVFFKATCQGNQGEKFDIFDISEF